MESTSQGWRPKQFQQPTLFPLSPPPQNNTTPNILAPKQPQLPSQLSPNPNNKQAQPVYNNDTTYQTYSMELQEINIILGKNFQKNQISYKIKNLRKKTLPYLNHKPLLTLKYYKK